MKLISIVGARPQFIKIAPLARAFARHNECGEERIESVIVHTGQHYDADMSDIFFEELDIPRPAINLGVGSGLQGKQTGQMLGKLEAALIDVRPDMVVIYGDTNSTIAGALAAAKLHIPVAHVEAGLRSFNRRMPEEINRVISDHLADLLLAPTLTAVRNLATEGLAANAVLTGDIMLDAVLFNRQLAEKKSTILSRLALVPGSYGVVTVHRAENTDNHQRLATLLSALNDIASDSLPLVLPLHPRTANELRSHGVQWSPHPQVHLIEPIGYLDMLHLVDHACVILTDSGGLQKEAFFLGCPCITLRDETEWVETIESGANILTGVEPNTIRSAVATWQRRFPTGNADFSMQVTASFGDGRAADRIVESLLTFHGSAPGIRCTSRVS